MNHKHYSKINKKNKKQIYLRIYFIIPTDIKYEISETPILQANLSYIYVFDLPIITSNLLPEQTYSI
jgi:hypothetical protein